MTHDLNSAFSGDLAGLSIDALLPERPAIIGEFSPAYEAFKTATLSDLEPMNNYEFVLALQLVDPRLILSQQYFDNFNYRRHSDTLPNLEKRARQLSAEYREVQKARPIDVVSVSQT